MSIEARSISKHFGAFAALDNVSVRFPAGQLTALLGPSGSGKTTLLRVIAGLETADAGSILFNGEDATRRSARDRRVGFVFQHYALFRHMTVFDNVAFGPRVKPRAVRPSRQEIADRVHRLLRLVQLDVQAARYPSQLSGGQRQRVALARALAVEPSVLLLDEPFGALDAKVRKELRRWLRRLHDEIHVTSIFVTHDVEEALEVSDQVVVMNEGRIEQTGSPAEVYDHPATPFVFDFMGSVSTFRTHVRAGHARLGSLSFAAPDRAPGAGEAAIGYARPHDIDIVREAKGEQLIEATVEQLNATGPTVRVELQSRASERPVEVELSRERQAELRLAIGDRVFLKPRQMTVYVENYSI